MEEEKAKIWVEENIETLKKCLALERYRLNIEYVRLEPTDNGAVKAMRVKPLPQYERALIEIDCSAIVDEADLEEHLRHELFHLFHSPFELVYQVLYEMLEPEDLKIVNVLWGQAEELTVRNLERGYIN